MLLMDTNAHALNDIKPSFQPNPIHTHYQKGLILLIRTIATIFDEYGF